MTSRHLKAALDPRSIAIVGASQNPDKIGGRPVDYLQRHGFKGRIYPINPGRAEVQGLRAYPTLEALPDAPDLAIIAVSRDDAVESVHQCAALGVRVCVVMASGFGEGHSVEGRAIEEEMVRSARATGMRIVGPNCQGLANFSNGALATFSTMIKECPPADGRIAILSQSGTLGMAPYGLLRRRGLGIRHAHATGNDADVTVAELAAEVAEDEQVQLMMLYLEGLPDPENLARLGRTAQDRGLPVLALKSGRTPAGQAAASSHTGAISSEDRVVDAFLQRHGIWRANTMEELVDAAEMYLKAWRIKGRRVVTVSNSGAAGVLATDAVINRGMQMAEFQPETRDALRAILPSFANISNPVDITGAILTDSSLFAKALSVIAHDAAADAFLAAFPVAGAGYDVESYAQAAARLEAQTGKPVVAASPQPDVAALFQAHGIPTFISESRAIAALDQLTGHHLLLQKAARRRPAPPVRSGPERPARMLNEDASLSLLSRHGVPVVSYQVCHSVEAAILALEEIGAPVVVKGCSSGVAHKTELGLVRIGVGSGAELRQIYEHFRHACESRGLPFDGLIVAELQKGMRELMIGARRDPVFGTVLVVGDGGKYVEVLGDNAILLAPCSAEEIAEKLEGLRIAPVLHGVRGEAPLDMESFIQAVLKVGSLMLKDASIHSIDVNPFIVSAQGQGGCAVDAVVHQFI